MRDRRTDVLLVPGDVTWFKAGLLDLEPLGISRVVLIARSAPARCHVRHDRTDVMWPLRATFRSKQDTKKKGTHVGAIAI